MTFELFIICVLFVYNVPQKLFKKKKLKISTHLDNTILKKENEKNGRSQSIHCYCHKQNVLYIFITQLIDIKLFSSAFQYISAIQQMHDAASRFSYFQNGAVLRIRRRKYWPVSLIRIGLHTFKRMSHTGERIRGKNRWSNIFFVAQVKSIKPPLRKWL